MKPENFEFGGGIPETIIHPAVIVAMLVTILLMLVLPRKYVVIPFLLCVFLVPRWTQLYVAGMHWTVMRIIVLPGIVRLARAKFQVAGGLNGIDKAFIFWAICLGVCQVLLFPQGGMAIYQAAFWLQAFGGYFLLRYVIQDEEDIARAAKTLAVLAVILGACMLNERIHSVNVFGYLSGASFLTPAVREGRVRAQATFAHAILAGCFGATLVPLFFWLWKSGRAKFAAFLGVIGSTLMVFTAASSTPVLACVAGVGALFLWPIRRSMRMLRWGIVLTLVGLAVVMKVPVWYVISHVNIVGGSTGWDRAALVDTFFKHFWDWWLIGTNQTGNWGWYMWDTANQYVDVGERGGLLAFICFIAIISRSFSRLGKMRREVEGDQKQEWFFWSLGAIMVAHVFAYFGASYFDQTLIWWWAFLAMVSAATAALQTAPAKVEGADTKYGATIESGSEGLLAIGKRSAS